MSSTWKLTLAVLVLCAATVCGQTTTQPQIGYLYPGGGQRGTTFQIVAGGQLLRSANEVHVSGQGVTAKVLKYIRPLRNLQQDQRTFLQQRLKEVRDIRLAELSGKTGVARKTTPKKPANTNKKEVKLPDHPLLMDLDNCSLRELEHIRSVLFFPRTKLQVNRQISEMVIIEVTIAPNAKPGRRELRLASKTTQTNPMVFQVGVLPEVRELEPNNREAYPVPLNLPRGVTVPREKPLDLPLLVNGQVMPGDVDRFRFRARKGQKLVIDAQARSLIPYLADAVPGWFQATLALYDAKGKEVAFADDYRFNPDPVLFYKIPKDGEYELEIRDSIYRGREDFVYRVSVSEQPFITQMFPLGGKAGAKTIASVSGWNLPKAQLPLDTRPGKGSIRETMYLQANKVSNSVPYAVDTLPEAGENESNNTTKDAQLVSLPKIINGRIDQPGDVDVFKFNGRAGGKVVAEVCSRRLNSPLDSLLRLTDASGKVLEWNDDHVLKESHLHTDIMGLITHHADSYLLADLPKDGTYYIHLSDSQNHGGQAYGYRLRITPPQVDFALRVAPSNLSIKAGGIVPLSVHALRKDGFDGDINVVVKDPDTGFKLEGATIPAGRNHVRMTLTAPAKGFDGAVALQLEGRAQVGDKTVSRPVTAADDVMQAFLYRHLVPAKELSVMVQKAKWSAPPITLAGRAPVRIPEGGTAVVRMNTRKGQTLRDLKLELREAPEGVTLHDVAIVPQGLAFRVTADKDALPTGFADNLIVEAFREYTPKPVKGKPAPQKRRTSMGVFPAIPFKIVQQ